MGRVAGMAPLRRPFVASDLRLRRDSLIGSRYGWLTVVGCEFRIGRHCYCVCVCDCGAATVSQVSSLGRGRTKSCGCNRCPTTHGCSGTKLHRVWKGIKDRCSNPRNGRYHAYGGRGVSICDEWRESFSAFRSWALANGYEEGLSIDRIDNDGGYSPGNCRWTTNLVQSGNRRDNVNLTAFGETKHLAAWLRDSRCKVTWKVLRRRIQDGISVEHAMSETGEAP